MNHDIVIFVQLLIFLILIKGLNYIFLLSFERDFINKTLRVFYDILNLNLERYKTIYQIDKNRTYSLLIMI